VNISLYDLSVWVLPLIIAITFHEAAHGFVAHALGDNTAFDRRPGQEQARGGAVVGAATAVLVDATAKFGKSHQPDAAIEAGGL